MSEHTADNYALAEAERVIANVRALADEMEASAGPLSAENAQTFYYTARLRALLPDVTPPGQGGACAWSSNRLPHTEHGSCKGFMPHLAEGLQRLMDHQARPIPPGECRAEDAQRELCEQLTDEMPEVKCPCVIPPGRTDDEEKSE
jgi:hypothetical protein